MERSNGMITHINFKAASAKDREAGVIGWLSGRVAAGLRLDGIAVRKTLAGELRLSYPERTDGLGRRHPYIKPVDDDARRRIEAEVFTALGLWEDEAS